MLRQPLARSTRLMRMLFVIALGCMVLLFNACTSSSSPEQAEATPSTADSLPDLQAVLSAKKEAFLQRADSGKIVVYEAGIDSVALSGVLDSAVQKGDTAPNFTLSSATGEPVELRQLLEQGPVVLTWYRGGWCPYCNLTLRAYQQALPAFRAQGAQLAALTPELPDSSLSTREKNALDFQVLSDTGNVVGRRYGLVYTLTDEVAAYYRKGLDLTAYNGHSRPELPLAATYVIDQQGVVRYAFLDADYRNRAQPRVVLQELRKLNSPEN